jgi:hypothetical protein
MRMCCASCPALPLWNCPPKADRMAATVVAVVFMLGGILEKYGDSKRLGRKGKSQR